jgi:Tfp pilus assembly protein PilV
MISPTPPRPSRRGASLIEVVVAMGVLAVAVPLVFAVIARSGQNAANARAETRSTWIIPACLNEIEAARTGASKLIPPRLPGQPFPADGQFLTIAFSEDGRPLGTIEQKAYATGIKTLADQPVRYLATIRTEPAPAAPGVPPMLNLHLTLEHPAAAPAAQRRKIAFHSRIP